MIPVSNITQARIDSHSFLSIHQYTKG